MTEGCDVMGVMESSGTLGGGYDQPHFLLGKPRYRVCSLIPGLAGGGAGTEPDGLVPGFTPSPAHPATSGGLGAGPGALEVPQRQWGDVFITGGTRWSLQKATSAAGQTGGVQVRGQCRAVRVGIGAVAAGV